MMFFFSSRRRHTRFDCDWSSDVCSSDLGMKTLARLLDLFTPGPLDASIKAYRSLLVGRIRPLWNVIVSNVPGPPVPLYVAGARLVGLFPLGPIYEGIGLNLTVISREESLDV